MMASRARYQPAGLLDGGTVVADCAKASSQWALKTNSYKHVRHYTNKVAAAYKAKWAGGEP